MLFLKIYVFLFRQFFGDDQSANVNFVFQKVSDNTFCIVNGFVGITKKTNLAYKHINVVTVGSTSIQGKYLQHLQPMNNCHVEQFPFPLCQFCREYQAL